MELCNKAAASWKSQDSRDHDWSHEIGHPYFTMTLLLILDANEYCHEEFSTPYLKRISAGSGIYCYNLEELLENVVKKFVNEHPTALNLT